jgi:hypothetical protein
VKKPAHPKGLLDGVKISSIEGGAAEAV